MAKSRKVVHVYNPNTRGKRTAEAQSIIDEMKRARRIRKGLLLNTGEGTIETGVASKTTTYHSVRPRKKTTKKRTTTKRATTTTTTTTTKKRTSVATKRKKSVSPTCRKAGRGTRKGSSASAKILGSKTCKTKSKVPKTKTTHGHSTAKRSVSKTSPIKRRTTRTSSCAKKITAIRRILKK